jgi:hypothetical protein
MHGDDGDLDVAVHDVENGICGISLREDRFVFYVPGNGTALAKFGEKNFWVKRPFNDIGQIIAPGTRAP